MFKQIFLFTIAAALAVNARITTIHASIPNDLVSSACHKWIAACAVRGHVNNQTILTMGCKTVGENAEEWYGSNSTVKGTCAYHVVGRRVPSQPLSDICAENGWNIVD